MAGGCALSLFDPGTKTAELDLHPLGPQLTSDIQPTAPLTDRVSEAKALRKSSCGMHDA
jgi:hypothetical protein